MQTRQKKLAYLEKQRKKLWRQTSQNLVAKRLCEKDVEVKLLDGKIEYSEKQRSRLWGKTSQKLSE